MTKIFRHSILLPVLFFYFNVSAQKTSDKFLTLGAETPPMKVTHWFKEEPVHHFKKGKIYVLDFWATWCGPCVAIMPHLSDLARKYKGKVIFLAIDIMENDTVAGPPTALGRDALIEKVGRFVDSMGKKMDFSVAIDDSRFMLQHWIRAFGEKQNGIPRDFVINEEGKIAWIGHPVYLDTILPKIVSHRWNLVKAGKRRAQSRYLQRLDKSVWDSSKYKLEGLSNITRADSMLDMITRLVKDHPTLKYAPRIAMFTFQNLLVKNPDSAYNYGEKVIHTRSYTSPSYYSIIGTLEDPTHDVKIPSYMYSLGAEAYKEILDHKDSAYRKNMDTCRLYDRIAKWYLLAGDTLKARKVKRKSYNTTIITHQKFFSTSSRAKLILKNYPYLLDTGTVLFAVKKDTLDGIRKTYRFYLPKKAILKVAVGKDSTYVPLSPRDTLYFEKTNTNTRNFISGEKGANISFREQPDQPQKNTSQKSPIKILNYSGMLLPTLKNDKFLKSTVPELFWKFYRKDKNLQDSAFNQWRKKAIRFDEIKAAAQKATVEYVENHPEFKINTYREHLLESWFAANILQEDIQLFVRRKNKLFSEAPLAITKLQNNIIHLASTMDHHIRIKTLNYWDALLQLNKNILMKKVEHAHYNLDTITRIIEPFTDTIREFILLNMLRDQNSRVFHHNLTWTAMAGKIQLEPFQSYLKKYLKSRFRLEPHYLNIALRSVQIVNTSMEVLTLDSLFRSTRKPYLYLAFCGSWNEESRENLVAYSEQQGFEEHKKVRPVWIFFENDEKEWLKTLDKYHLPKQDCFLIKGKNILKIELNFGQRFHWSTDFPHYFLFTKKGECLNSDALPFSDFDKTEFLKKRL